MRVIISGGGTGGHIFPAIAIADELKRQDPGVEVLFVGAEGKMEMERVPAAGYQIEGLPIRGLQRRLTLGNLAFPFRLLTSMWRARRLVAQFAPDVAIGVGGYASGPTLYAAQRAGIPTLIQEQNSYPGITNKMLAKRVDRVCVAYDGMDRWFDPATIALTGNPVRADIIRGVDDRKAARRHFGLDPSRATILVTGGSLGAGSINAAIADMQAMIAARPDVNILWQAGKIYIDRYRDSPVGSLPQVELVAFLDDMPMAYAAADVIICRAGALTISELCIVHKPAILVPSPNVSEDHQTKNAMALVDRGAAMLVRDTDVRARLVQQAYELVDDPRAQDALRQAIGQLARPRATQDIVAEIRSIVASS